MHKTIFALILSALPIFALAANDTAADALFSKQEPTFTPQEKSAIAIANKWKLTTSIKPISGTEGSVRFIFGAQQISIVCAVLQVCDVELQAGEQVNNLNVGDPRFTVEPAIAVSVPPKSSILLSNRWTSA